MTSDGTKPRSLPDPMDFDRICAEATTIASASADATSSSGPSQTPLGLSTAQDSVAQSYGFPSWEQLRERIAIESIKTSDQVTLKQVVESVGDPHAWLAKPIQAIAPTNHAIGHDATLLQFASYRSWGQANTTSFLIAKGATLDLHSACGLGRTESISTLLQADPTGFERKIDTYFPVQYAISGARPQAIDCLMRHGDDPNRELRKVAYFGWEDETLGQDYTPWKPLHMASLYGFNANRVPVAEALVNHGADMNAISPLDGYRPIHLVAMPNRVDMIQFLIKRGVDVDSPTGSCRSFQANQDNAGPVPPSEGITALMVAAGEGFAEATACLLESGADPRVADSLGNTALHYAARRFWNGQPYDSVIDTLLKHGADSTALNLNGDPPRVADNDTGL